MEAARLAAGSLARAVEGMGSMRRALKADVATGKQREAARGLDTTAGLLERVVGIAKVGCDHVRV